MSVFKSVFSGVGTGAGVAWPVFGIVSSVLGASTHKKRSAYSCWLHLAPIYIA